MPVTRVLFGGKRGLAVVVLVALQPGAQLLGGEHEPHVGDEAGQRVEARNLLEGEVNVLVPDDVEDPVGDEQQ